MDWADEDYDEVYYSLGMTSADASKVEERLANTEFIHGWTYQGDMDQALNVMREQLKGKEEIPSDGIILETAANWRSVVSKQQFDAYQNDLVGNVNMRIPTK